MGIQAGSPVDLHSASTVGGQAFWHAGNFTPGNYVLLAGVNLMGLSSELHWSSNGPAAGIKFPYGSLCETYSLQETIVGHNIYVNPADVVAGQLRTKRTNASAGHTFHKMVNGAHTFYGASGSVTADAVLSPTLQATLSSSGFNLAVGSFTGSGAGLTSIPNSALTNSSVTLGTTTVALGATTTTVAGLAILSINDTTAANTGVLQKGGTTYIHNYGSTTINHFVGKSAGNYTLTGTHLLGFGYFSLNKVTSATYSMGVGNYTLAALTTGSNNLALAHLSLQSLTTGTNNSFGGYAAGRYLVTGDNNTGFGSIAMNANTTGSGNSTFGSGAGSALKATSAAISAFADYSATVAGTVKATSAAHGRTTGDSLIIAGTTNFNGTYTITVIDVDNFYFTKAWVLLAGEVGWWTLSGFLASNNSFFGLNAGSSVITGSGNTILGQGLSGSSNLTNNILIGSGGTARATFDGTSWTLTGGISTPGTLQSTSTYGWLIGSAAGVARVEHSAGTFSFLTTSNGYAALATGAVTAAGAVVVTGSTGSVAGSLCFSAGDGLRLWGKTGTNYDFTVLNVAGSAYVLKVPTGTNNVVFDGVTTLTGGFTAQAISYLVASDARFYIRGGAATNGFLIEQDTAKDVYLWNYEASNLYIGTSGTTRIGITSAGVTTFSYGVVFSSTTTFNGASQFNSTVTERYVPASGYNASQITPANTGARSLLWNAISASRAMYSDEEFEFGLNGVTVYNNAGGAAVVVTREADATAPNKSGYRLKVYYDGVTTPAPTPGLGGFLQIINSRANAVFVQRFIAKLPVGFNFMDAQNSQGTNAQVIWLTPTAGTGKWEEYIRWVYCGDSGSFGSGGHVYVNGTGTYTCYLASINVYDLHSAPPLRQASPLRWFYDAALQTSDKQPAYRIDRPGFVKAIRTQSKTPGTGTILIKVNGTTQFTCTLSGADSATAWVDRYTGQTLALAAGDSVTAVVSAAGTAAGVTVQIEVELALHV